MTGQTQEPTVLLQLTIRAFGNVRKGDKSEIATSADKKLLSLGKRLLDCAEYKQVRRHNAETIEAVRARSVPSYFKSGIYVILASAGPALDALLKERKDDLDHLVDGLCSVYEQRTQEAQLRLGSQFRWSDYPALSAFRLSFGMEWRIFQLSAPEAGSGVDPAFVEEQRRGIAAMMEAARAEGLALVREEFAGLVSHLFERLTPDEEGAKKVLRASAVTKLQDFLELFSFRNVAGDAGLEPFIAKTRALLSGVDPETLRDSEITRDRLRQGFAGMKDEIAALVDAAPRRLLDLEALGAEG